MKPAWFGGKSANRSLRILRISRRLKYGYFVATFVNVKTNLAVPNGQAGFPHFLSTSVVAGWAIP